VRGQKKRFCCLTYKELKFKRQGAKTNSQILDREKYKLLLEAHTRMNIGREFELAL
jgi:hypothetical protein